LDLPPYRFPQQSLRADGEAIGIFELLEAPLRRVLLWDWRELDDLIGFGYLW
jgi:hypothetical protein